MNGQLVLENGHDLVDLPDQIRDDFSAVIGHQRFAVDLAVVIQLVTRTADGETVDVEECSYLADELDFVSLVITSVSPPFDRFELREFLFPVSQYVRFDGT